MGISGRKRRKLRIRRKVVGTSEQPRLSVFRSSKHIYAQAINDTTGNTLAHVSTLSKEVREHLQKADKSDAAQQVGIAVANLLLARGIQRVVFDRNGYLYHGRVKGLADAARRAGLRF